MISEMKKRRWLGVELGPTNGIIERFENIQIEEHYLKSLRMEYNRLFTKETKAQRIKKGLWVEETFNGELFNS